MAKKQSIKKSTPKELWASINEVRFCPNCGRSTIMQNPVKETQHILECSKCGVEFKIQII